MVAQVAVANLLPLRHVLSVLEYRNIPYKRHPRRIRARRVRKHANTRRVRWRITDVDGVLRDGEGYEGQRAVAQAAYRSFHSSTSIGRGRWGGVLEAPRGAPGVELLERERLTWRAVLPHSVASARELG